MKVLYAHKTDEPNYMEQIITTTKTVKKYLLYVLQKEKEWKEIQNENN